MKVQHTIQRQNGERIVYSVDGDSAIIREYSPRGTQTFWRERSVSAARREYLHKVNNSGYRPVK